MSAHYSPASVGLTWGLKEQGTASSSSARPTPIADKSSPATGPESRSTKMSVTSLSGNDHATAVGEAPPVKVSESGGGALLTSSAEDSPAKTSPSPGGGADSAASDPAFSSSSHESLTLFSPMGDGSS